jgi:hypothetical protein
MLAIETKYLGPTNRRGAVIRAVANDHFIEVPYDHEPGERDNHAAAAMLFVRQYLTSIPKDALWVAGETERGYVFVCTLGDEFSGYFKS